MHLLVDRVSTAKKRREGVYWGSASGASGQWTEGSEYSRSTSLTRLHRDLGSIPDSEERHWNANMITANVQMLHVRQHHKIQ